MNKETPTPHQAWDVILRGRVIDTVFYTPNKGEKDVADTVRRSLIDHDGYHPNIQVRRGK